MNKERRKKLDSAKILLNQAQQIIDEAINEEQEYYDNMPESFQDAEKGTIAEDAIDAMSNATDSIDEAISYIDDAEI